MFFLSQISSLQFSTRRQTKTVLEEIIQGTQKPQLSQCRKHPYKWKVYTFTLTYVYYVSGTVPVQFQSITQNSYSSKPLGCDKVTGLIFIIYLHDQIITTPNNVHLSSGATNIYQL